jgi:hypothetical protein
MNKKSLFFLGLFALIIGFAGCSKSNVTNGEKRIVGTWVLQLGEDTYSYVEVEDRDYEANDCDEESYKEETTYSGTATFNGTTLTRTQHSKIKYTSGNVTETEESDTTITYTYSFEITFNEDGSCFVKTKQKDHGSQEVNNMEETGRWYWIDANLEKVGIHIEGDHYSEMVMYIKSLDKKELIVSINQSFASEHTNNYTCEECCYNYTNGTQTDLIYSTYHTESYTSSGSQTFSKLKE